MAKVLKCNKTQLYKLAAEYLREAPPAMRRCEFQKAYRTNDYWLRWSVNGYDTDIFLCVSLGRCVAAITLSRKNDEGTRYRINRHTVTIPLEVLEARDMVAVK